MLRMIVQTGILAVDSVTFTDHAACPECNGTLAPHDTKEKRFAVVVTGDAARTVSVHVKRYYCRSCHKLSYADEPFYPETRIGSPVIDLCIALSITMPANRVAAYLEGLGVLVDRSSCRLYIRSGQNSTRNNHACLETNVLFGIHLPLSVISLSELASVPGTRQGIPGREILNACRFPSGRQIPRNVPCPGREGNVSGAIDRKGPGARV